MDQDRKYNLEIIADVIGGRLYGPSQTIIEELSIDSRTLLVPAQTLFFALVGAIHDGHDYIDDLYYKGVRSFVVSRFDDFVDKYDDANFIVVGNTLSALQNLAEYRRSNFLSPVIGITGSNGKTIVKEWLFQLLHNRYSIVRSPKSYNSQVGVPLSLWGLHQKATLALIEAGISQPGEMTKLSGMIRPDGGIFTNLGDAHRENFPSEKARLEEKLNLFEKSQWLIYCKDHELVHKVVSHRFSHHKIKCFTWSRKQDADLRIIKQQILGNKTLVKGVCKGNSLDVEIPFTDAASIENALHCLAFMLYMEMDTAFIKEGLMSLQAVAMRMEIKEGISNCTLINDYYNSDLASLSIALDLLNQQRQQRKKTLILSDIYQSGYSAHILYCEVAELLRNKQVDRLIGIGGDIMENSRFFDLEKTFYATTDQFITDFSRNQFSNEAILIRGSRDFHFERISNMLQYKAHRTVLEVNLNAMVHNLNYFRSLLDPHTKVVVMVKAFSYGSGSVEIANMLQFQRVDYLAVAIADEGVELRNAGIDVPIIVMNPELHSFDTMIEYRLEPEIYSLSILTLFQEALKRNGVKGFPVHIKLDTGMRRMGFVEDELDALLQHVVGNEFVHIRSVFSHLAGADEIEHDDFTRLQIKRFRLWSDRIRSCFDYPVMLHILNSAGIERFHEAQFDMVRLGIGLYGISPFHQEKLQNVSTLRTTISQIKSVPAKDTVGYGRKGLLERDSRIGIIPIGYADGFNRHLSNGVGHVLVNGHQVPVVGNVCMDMSIIDLTDVEAREGDTVIIFGDDYPITKIASQLNTIPYEILTSVSRRVKRIYYQE